MPSPGTPRRLTVAALVAIAATAACLGGYPLPTGPEPPPGGFVCNMAGVSGTLQGSATDPAVAWLVTREGRRHNVVWPWGFTAVFQPDLVVLGPDRSVVARSGDVLHLAGSWTDGNFGACAVNGTFYVGDP